MVVSNSTATLDIIQVLCQGNSWESCRLDGSTDANKRQVSTSCLFYRKLSCTCFDLFTPAGQSSCGVAACLPCLSWWHSICFISETLAHMQDIVNIFNNMDLMKVGPHQGSVRCST